MPPHALRTTGIVRQIKLVNQIWTTDMEGHPDSEGGQPIGTPFQMLELELAPRGAREPVHVVDRIDLNSVPGLHVGEVVPVEYSASDPLIARVAGASRNYARHAETYLLGLTFGFAAALTFIVFPVARAVRRFARSSPMLRALRDPRRTLGEAASKLPANDPRRKRLEEMLRAIKNGKVGD